MPTPPATRNEPCIDDTLVRPILLKLLAIAAAAPILLAGACSTTPAPAREDTFTRARREIAEAQALALPAGHYRVEVERIWLGERDAWAIGAVLSSTSARTARRIGRPVRDPGFRIVTMDGDVRTVLTGALSRTTSNSRETATVVTLPDSPASLAIGEVRYGIPIDLGGRRGVLLIPEGSFAGTSLDVKVSRPTGPAGDEVDVTITPVFSRRSFDAETIHLTEMATTVRVRIGQPILIGREQSDRETVATGILSRGASREREQAVVIMTVRDD